VSGGSLTVKMKTDTVVAIDGHSLLYRAFFAIPDSIRDASGRPVNAIHGFISMLARLLREHRPSSVIVAYDSPWPTLRHVAFPGYKANRAALPEACTAQVPLLRTLLQRIGIPIFAVPGYEGDDILAAFAERCAARNLPTVIVTGDRDLFQLVRDPWIRLLYTRRGVSNAQLLDERGVQNLVGVLPSRYVDLAALRGDPADNISGIPGIGDKTALSLIAHAPSFEELYKDLNRLPKDIARKLLAGRDTLSANREILRALGPVPVNWDAQPLLLRIDVPNARGVFSELGLEKTCESLLSAYFEVQPETRLSVSAPAAEWSSSTEQLLRHRNRVCLVSCSAEKSDMETQAKDLYVSTLFKKSRNWAELGEMPWYILSAKHGLVAPEISLQPYDLALKDLPHNEREAWGESVASDIRRVSPAPALVFLLAGSTYSGAITKSLIDSGYGVARPLEGMPVGKRLRWLNAANSIGKESADLEEFYEILTRLISDAGGLVPLSQAAGRRWPPSGVYFFFEPGESRFCTTQPRVVRVGTHGVSVNSKASLWNRLRTHRGVLEGAGNHRASIFRSHVGAAIIQRDSRMHEFPDWADQSAGTAENRLIEAELETQVSAIISRMQIVCLEIRDTPGPHSDRAYVERNAIALLSRVGSLLDRPSGNWLGRCSPHPCIRKSGLWNVNYVDEPAWDPTFLEIFEYYARATVGRAPLTERSVAPPGWWTRLRSRGQMDFSWNDKDDDVE
jgi:5'-3' exonuclease